VKYATLQGLGIDPAYLDFHDLAEAQFHIARLTERHLHRSKEGLVF
jgi:hypothetical protein